MAEVLRLHPDLVWFASISGQKLDKVTLIGQHPQTMKIVKVFDVQRVDDLAEEDL
jgi:hypothetical protein